MEWPVILALVIGIPIVLFVPVLVWGAVVSGLYQVMRDAAVRRRATAARRRARLAEEPVVRR
jgi:hypothetical protein